MTVAPLKQVKSGVSDEVFQAWLQKCADRMKPNRRSSDGLEAYLRELCDLEPLPLEHPQVRSFLDGLILRHFGDRLEHRPPLFSGGMTDEELENWKRETEARRDEVEKLPPERFGLKVHGFHILHTEKNEPFIDADDIAAVAANTDARTKAVFCESIGNPLGNVVDFAALADAAHAQGLPLIVDNTVPTPYLTRPIEHGADIVVHALTKYIGGHGTSIGGAIIDSGNFPWAEHKARFRRLNEPEVSYHGVVYTEALGPAAYIGRVRTVLLRNTGAAISPFNSFLILQGLETLALRMDRHVENATAVANYLKGHPKVKWVNYARLPDHPGHALIQKYFGGKASGLLTFGVDGGREAGGQAVHPPGQYRRRQVPGLPPGLNHPPPAVAGRAEEGRRDRGHGSPVSRHRTHRRPDRGPGPGPGGGLSLNPPGSCTAAAAPAGRCGPSR